MKFKEIPLKVWKPATDTVELQMTISGYEDSVGHDVATGAIAKGDFWEEVARFYRCEADHIHRQKFKLEDAERDRVFQEYWVEWYVNDMEYLARL